jgi:hypothetical protein
MGHTTRKRSPKVARLRPSSRKRRLFMRPLASRVAIPITSGLCSGRDLLTAYQVEPCWTSSSREPMGSRPHAGSGTFTGALAARHWLRPTKLVELKRYCGLRQPERLRTSRDEHMHAPKYLEIGVSECMQPRINRQARGCCLQVHAVAGGIDAQVPHAAWGLVHIVSDCVAGVCRVVGPVQYVTNRTSRVVVHQRAPAKSSRWRCRGYALPLAHVPVSRLQCPCPSP